HVYALLAAADLDREARLRLPDELPDARFATPGSGLYGQVTDGSGATVWHSRSLLGLALPVPVELAAGARQLTPFDSNGRALLALSFGITWEDARGTPLPFTFSVAEDLDPLRAEITGFRRALWGWLGGATVLLLLVQGSILRWSLRPLRRVAGELEQVESGAREQLGSGYPGELVPLTGGINRLLAHAKARQEVYRRGLGDLAHSLKTPLAVLRGSLGGDDRGRGDPAEAARQIDRMAAIVEYQLQRAAMAGRRPFAAPVEVAAIFGKVAASLDKVYRDRGLQIALHAPGDPSYRAEEGDLLELAGNLLDNACKWARARVEVTLEALATSDVDGLLVRVDDDGPGIPEAQASRLLERGLRADSATPGHGLGLAIVNDIVAAYGGTLAIARGPLGGARVEIRLPG
ncbi:MAG TPA: ATP-binding protein, partial [Gammaproteobacteria bacterium]